MLVEASPDYVVLVDSGDVVRHVNRALLQKLGYAAGELLGQPLSRLHPDRLRAQHEESTRRFRNEPAGAALTCETRVRQSNGEEFPAEITARRIERGREAWLALFIRDISKRLEWHRKLIDTERRLR